MASQIILFSMARTACHMLERMLSKQSNVHYLWHPLVALLQLQSDALTPENIARGNFSDEVLSTYADTAQEGVTAWQKALADSKRAGQILFIHNHPILTLPLDQLLQEVGENSYPRANGEAKNITFLPEHVLLHPGTVPIFTIRHPILHVPSLYRAANVLGYNKSTAAYHIAASLSYTREMYDYYLRNNIKPIVIDADDYMTSEDFVRLVCTKAGLNPAEAVFNWTVEPEDREASEPTLSKTQATLVNSKGPEAARAAKNLDLEEQQEKWKDEFTESELQLLEEMVARTMPHYEFLRARRLIFVAAFFLAIDGFVYLQTLDRKRKKLKRRRTVCYIS